MKSKKTISLLMALLVIGIMVPVKPTTNISDSQYISFAEAKKTKKVKRKDHLRRYNYLISLGITESFIKQYTTKRLKSSDVNSIVDLWNGEDEDSDAKVYDFTLTCNSSNPEAEADKSIVWSSGDPDEYEFYKKFAFSEIKLASMPKMKLCKKMNFYSGMSEESWACMEPSFYTEGYLWLAYGYKDTDDGEHGRCSISADTPYRLFIYE